MGFLEKMKNLFTEEEEIIEPVKKEVMQVEIKAPTVKKEPKVERVEHQIEEPIMPKEEVKPTPVFFDDKDFVTLEQQKTRQKRKEVKNEREMRPIYNMKQDRRDKRSFQPSPIISPVYGILDKNYKKEDIVNKKDDFVSTYYKTTKEMTVDEVRKKAFGTLEDDIDLNLEADIRKTEKEVEQVPSFEKESLENDIFEEMDVAELHDEAIDNSDLDVTLGNTPDELPMESNMVEESLGKEVDQKELDESDLFNLIDSMYEKRDEE